MNKDRAAPSDDCDRATPSDDYDTLPLKALWWKYKPLPVIVGEIYSPEFFWLIPCFDESFCKFREELSQFCFEYMRDVGPVQDSDLVVNLPCAVLCANQEFYRGVLTNIFETSSRPKSYEIFFVDYGNVAVVEQTDICYLEHRFVQLPAQAFMGSLSGFNVGSSPSRTRKITSDHFRYLTEGRRIEAECTSTENEVSKVVLRDLDDNTTTINDKMIEFIKPKSVNPVISSAESGECSKSESDDGELSTEMLLRNFREQASSAVQTCIEGCIEKRDHCKLEAQENSNEHLLKLMLVLQTKIEGLQELKTNFVEKVATKML